MKQIDKIERELLKYKFSSLQRKYRTHKSEETVNFIASSAVRFFILVVMSFEGYLFWAGHGPKYNLLTALLFWCSYVALLLFETYMKELDAKANIEKELIEEEMNAL